MIEDKPASIAKISFDIGLLYHANRDTESKERFLMTEVPTWFLVDGQQGKEGGAQRRGRLPAVGAEEGGRGGAGGCCGSRPCWRRPLRAPPRGTSTSSSSWRERETTTPPRRRRGRGRGLAGDEAQRGDVVVELQQQRVEAAGEAGGADRDDGRGRSGAGMERGR